MRCDPREEPARNEKLLSELPQLKPEDCQCVVYASGEMRSRLVRILRQAGHKIIEDLAIADGYDVFIADFSDLNLNARNAPVTHMQSNIALVDIADHAMVTRAIEWGASQLHPLSVAPELLLHQIEIAKKTGVGSAKGDDGFNAITDSGISIRDVLTQWTCASDKSWPVQGILIGLRRLEAINTTYGGHVGDSVLATISTRLHELASNLNNTEVDTKICVGRLSGSEFLILGRRFVDREHWQAMAEQAIAQIAKPIVLADGQVRVTARAALAILKDGEDRHSFVNRLVGALSHAHKHQSSDVQWADRQSDLTPENGHRLERDIVHAVDRDEIIIRFQPQFSVGDSRITGAEALARWNHPEHGEIDAGSLFALAEKADFTRQLSAHIRFRAMQLAAQWPAALSDLRLSINVTARDIAERNFAAIELERIAKAGFPINRLTLEITESALVPNLKKASSVFKKLRDTGLRIAIDDFGTGYSNMLYLKALPLDYLKLDHVMTRDIDGQSHDRIIVRSMIALGRALSLEVIAEGVETEEQREALAQEGCDFYQGFLKSPALSPEEFEQFALRAN